jgi:predicted small secreted protein
MAIEEFLIGMGVGVVMASIIFAKIMSDVLKNWGEK